MATKEQIKEFVYVDNNWFREKYEAKLSAHSSRYWTMKAALNLMMQRDGTKIVETGCVRQEEDYGAGNSTLIFADFAQRYGCTLTSIDNDERHAGICRGLLDKHHPGAPYKLVVNDSVAELERMAEAGEKIDLLYLDSFDYPLGELLDIYGGKTDLNQALETLNGFSTDEVVAKHKSIIDPCQKHCLNELLAALPTLTESSLILIDDVGLAGRGKGRLAIDWLLDSGSWECVLEDYQALFVRKD